MYYTRMRPVVASMFSTRTSCRPVYDCHEIAWISLFLSPLFAITLWIYESAFCTESGCGSGICEYVIHTRESQNLSNGTSQWLTNRTNALCVARLLPQTKSFFSLATRLVRACRVHCTQNARYAMLSHAPATVRVIRTFLRMRFIRVFVLLCHCCDLNQS